MLKRRILLACYLWALLIFSNNLYAASEFVWNIIGINDVMLKNVNARLVSEKDELSNHLTDEQLQKFYQRTPEIIRKALEPYGYFKTKIKSNLSKQKDKWLAQYMINPGLPILIRTVDIKIVGEGQGNIALKQLLRDIPLKTHMIFSTPAYEKLKDDLLLTLNNQGFIKSYFIKNEVLIDLKKYHVDITLHLETGERFYFGKVNFAQGPYEQTFLQRIISFNGQPFSSDKLTDLQDLMTTSPYFSSVTVLPDFEHISNHRVPIHINFTVPKSQKYNFGLGYGTFTGPRLTSGVHLRRTTTNGQYFDGQIKLSKVMSGLALNYTIPAANPLLDKWVIGANYGRFQPKNGQSQSGTLSVSYIQKRKHWQNNYNLNYLTERYSVDDNPSQHASLFYPSWALSYLKVDDLINPAQGISVNLSLKGTAKQFASSTSFLQGETKAKFLYSLLPSTQVILRGNLGYTVVNKIKLLPLTMRFFAGGLNSVRGFSDSGIGPGKYLTVGSIELQQQIFGAWKAAIFYDVGNASNKLSSPWVNRGEGVGIIYQSMMGPIKLYAAQGISKLSSHRSIEFSIGPEF